MDLATVAMITALALLGYFMLIRPQQKRAKEQTALMKSLEAGTRVMMSGGVYGTLRHVGDKQVVVEVSPGVEMTFVKQAIVRPLKDDEDEFEYDDDTVLDAPVVATAAAAGWDQPPAVAVATDVAGDPVVASAELPTVDEAGSGEPQAKAADQG
jgi:preprotein translocase subunit YajC